MNQLEQLFDFVGSANVQKAIGVIGGPTLAIELNTLPSWIRAAFAVAGPAFAALVHAIDAYRAKYAPVPVTTTLVASAAHLPVQPAPVAAAPIPAASPVA